MEASPAAAGVVPSCIWGRASEEVAAKFGEPNQETLIGSQDVRRIPFLFHSHLERPTSPTSPIIIITNYLIIVLYFHKIQLRYN
jgi:hypothetical protein